MSAVPSPSSFVPAADAERLAALERFDILDTPAEPAFDRIAHLVRLIFEVETALVTMIDAHRQWYKAALGTSLTEVPLGDSFCQYTLAAAKPLVVPDASLDARFSVNRHVTAPDGIRFYAGVPLVTSDKQIIGTICAIDRTPRSFSERELAILCELAEVVMSELELRQLATSDGLTGIATRRAFKAEAEKYVALARRHRSQLSVVTFDVDHFKKVNDAYGHAGGDMVLKAITRAAQDGLRKSDLLGRLGGEEFAAVLPDADAAAAMAVAEKLRYAFRGLDFPGSRPPIKVTASFGVATLDPGRDDLDSVLLKADEALYEAKRSGRNKSLAWRGATTATVADPVDRRRVLKAGRLVFNARRSTLDCTVRALWENGAEIQVASPADIPEEVTLEVVSSGHSWDARVVQRRPTSLELAFG
ncbi:diguanylate cyclase with GAF sensor [Devosia lucknowensis]|uniref:diguanylate cyclase n=1 Tax=Devosia lucknowensis TaxID=1096929 RepID=A0A1Y6G6L5_9HYPH|nr:sensor domain-containing diguanylate cyclase [Devosia lucknowensis]SMQ85812.1 diguanylate cyclase with GAF sensor [Devosia lucknowensis]